MAYQASLVRLPVVKDVLATELRHRSSRHGCALFTPLPHWDPFALIGCVQRDEDLLATFFLSRGFLTIFGQFKLHLRFELTLQAPIGIVLFNMELEPTYTEGFES